jgi:hypothetical protein
MTYRKQSSEAVSEYSWLMRNLWDVTTPRGKGVVTIPKYLKSSGVKRLVERALWAQGLRKTLASGRRVSVADLTQKTHHSELLIESKLQQKDSELSEWKKRYLKDIKGLIEQMNAMKEFQKETRRELSEIKRFRASFIRK